MSLGEIKEEVRGLSAEERAELLALLFELDSERETQAAAVDVDPETQARMDAVADAWRRSRAS